MTKTVVAGLYQDERAVYVYPNSRIGGDYRVHENPTPSSMKRLQKLVDSATYKDTYEDMGRTWIVATWYKPELENHPYSQNCVCVCCRRYGKAWRRVLKSAFESELWSPPGW